MEGGGEGHAVGDDYASVLEGVRWLGLDEDGDGDGDGAVSAVLNGYVDGRWMDSWE